MAIDREVLTAKLVEFRQEHRDLDDGIAALIEQGGHDQLKLQRMKKKKLALKDMIGRIASILQPDIIA